MNVLQNSTQKLDHLVNYFKPYGVILSLFEYKGMNKTLRSFNECTECGKILKEIDVDIQDIKAMSQEIARERLCNKCVKKSKFNDDVITIELRKRGIIK